jgi:hypothetical protein
MKIAGFTLLASLLGAQAFVAPAPRMGARTRGVARMSVDDILGTYLFLRKTHTHTYTHSIVVEKYMCVCV